jgi:hypothetical protein
MAALMRSVQVHVEDIYGWCGLCRTFVEFPHDCAGADTPAEEDEGPA